MQHQTEATMSTREAPQQLVETSQERLRELFLQRQPSYRLSEAARLLGMSRGSLQREAERDQREAYRVNGRWRFTWRQVAYIAFRRWTLAQIHDALGPDASTVLPPLLALRSLTVRLPEYLVRAIELSAIREETTIDDWLHRELMDFAGTVANRIEGVVPGFRSAYLFPGQDQLRKSRRHFDAPSRTPPATLSLE
jgi:hypothetical protein